MPLETVRVRVLDDALAPQPVEGVVVRFFDSTGTTLVTTATTDADGYADTTLNVTAPSTNFQARFYLPGISITSPQMLAVFSPASASPSGTNDFEASAQRHELPEAVDPRLCRVSGKILRPDGRPRAGVDIHFIHLFEPLVAGGDIVGGERTAVRTDRDGEVVVDLFRGGRYFATVQGFEEVQREIVVPDRASVLLSDLLFPVVVLVEWDPVGPWNVSVDGTQLVTPTVTSCDHRVLAGVAQEDVNYATDDPSIATVAVLDATRIVIRGVAVGTTQLRVTRRDDSIKRVPDGIEGIPIAIHVA